MMHDERTEAEIQQLRTMTPAEHIERAYELIALTSTSRFSDPASNTTRRAEAATHVLLALYKEPVDGGRE